MKKYFKNQFGISLLETVIAMVVAAMTFCAVAETLSVQSDSYSFITQRKQVMASARFAIASISHDILRVDSTDILAIDDHGITYLDENGVEKKLELVKREIDSQGFSEDDDNRPVDLKLNDEVLLYSMAAFDLTYYDQNGDVLPALADNISLVRQIKISLATQAVHDEGSVILATTLTPRAFLGYANYQ